MIAKILSVCLLVCFAGIYTYGSGTLRLFWVTASLMIPDDGDSDFVIELNYSSSWADIFEILVTEVICEDKISSKFVDNVGLDDFDLTSDLD